RRCRGVDEGHGEPPEGNDAIDKSADHRAGACEPRCQIMPADVDALPELLNVCRNGAERVRFVGDATDEDALDYPRPSLSLSAHLCLVTITTKTQRNTLWPPESREIRRRDGNDLP